MLPAHRAANVLVLDELDLESAVRDAVRLSVMAEQSEINQQRLRRCESIRQRVLRGDAIVGVVSIADIEQMVATYRELGAAGVADAWVGLGRYHLDPSGLHRSVADAAECACRAVAAGSLDGVRLLRVVVPAQHDMEHQPPSASNARHALERMLASDDTGLVHHVLGLLAFHGLGGPKDVATYVQHQVIAADRGHADALFEMSVLLATGTGVVKDFNKALGYCRKAAELDHPRACYNLGAFHATGRGVKRDEAKARTWYERASNAGHGEATATLAAMVMTGSGGDADPTRAEELFDRAGEQGIDVAAFRQRFGI
jgi:TPR repeat protein